MSALGVAQRACCSGSSSLAVRKAGTVRLACYVAPKASASMLILHPPAGKGPGRWNDRTRQLRARTLTRVGAVRVQASLVSRVVRIVKAYVGGASDSLLASLERPDLMIAQAVEEMTNDLARARQGHVRVLADQKLAERRAKIAAESADMWQRRAELAVQQGDDELAREALRRKRVALEERDVASAQASDLAAAAASLGESIKVLGARVADARAREGGLKVRANAAAAQAEQQQALAELVAGIPKPGTAWAEFERMEAKVEGLEARVAATAEVNGLLGAGGGSGGSGGDAAGRRLLALEAEARVEAELEALKRGVAGRHQPQRLLPPFQR